MLSQTTICNVALSRIGIRQPIANIDENSETASICKLFFEQSLSLMFRERDWPFAQRQVDLALVSTNPTPNWSYSYRYPANFISIVDVRSDSSTGSIALPSNAYNLTVTDSTLRHNKSPFTISSDVSGRLIYSNQASAIATGTYYVDDVLQFDPVFADALAWKLAYEIAIPLTRDSAMRDMARTEYENAVSTAFANSLEESYTEVNDDSDFISSRY